MHAAFRLLIATSVTTLFIVTPAQAQTAPPIKAGLWELQVERGGGAPKLPDMNEHLKSMPPEARKRIEALMKSQGVDVSAGGGVLKICLSKEALNEGAWQGAQGSNCKTDFANHEATHWSWRSVCTTPQSETNGEATFADPEHYTVKSTTTTVYNGEKKTLENTIKSTWAGADCGDVKPLQPPVAH